MYWRVLIQRRPSVYKRLHDGTVLKRVFRDNFVIFRLRSKRIAFLESVNYSTNFSMQIFNFRNGHVTTFRHPSGTYVCQMPGHKLSRLAKAYYLQNLGFPSVPLVWGKTVSCRLCAGQSKGILKREKWCFSYLAPPTLQNFGIFNDRTRPHLNFDGLLPKSRWSVVSIGLRVRYKYYRKKT